MSEQDYSDQEFKIPFADVVKAIKRGKTKILVTSLACSALLGGFALVRPVLYEGKGTFKEKLNSRNSMNSSSVASVLLNGLNSVEKSEAKTMMSSRKLLGQVVKRMNLQASLNEKSSLPGLFKSVFESLAVEYNYLRGLKKHPLKESENTVSIANVEFPGEFPLSLSLQTNPDGTFEVFSARHEKIGSGKLGTPFSTRNFSFTLVKTGDTPLREQFYTLSLSPLADIIDHLSKKIAITPEKDDPSLLQLTYFNRNRRQACDVVNQLMYAYQDHLRNEQQRIAQEQILYLNRREGEMDANLNKLIGDYAARLSSEVSALGYADSEKAMDFLTEQLQDYREKTLMLDLNLKKLTSVLNAESDLQIDAYFRSDSTPMFLRGVINEISELKMQGDAIELAIRNASNKNARKWEGSFPEQLAEIEEIRQCSDEACQLLALLKTDQRPPREFSTLLQPKYMVKSWYEMLEEMDAGQAKIEEKKQFREQFAAYLSGLVHYLELREKSVRERINRQTPQSEFQGINSKSADQLYIAYSKDLSNMESEILQYKFLIDELEDPEFEISSLSSVTGDPVTRDLVDEAGKLALALHDNANRSERERERIKKELDVHRRFISQHLNQTVELLELRKSLIQDKILALQSSTLELVQQRVSVLESQLSDSILAHISNLREEKELLAENQAALASELSTLPKKWASEKMIEQKLKMNAAMVEEVAKLVESKNITANLEMVQSAPVDLAVPKAKPVRPGILLFSVAGAILGAMFSSFFIVASNIVRGFPVSRESLELAGLHVSGNCRGPLLKLAAFLCRKNGPKGSSLLIASPINAPSIEMLSRALKKLDQTVLLLELTPGDAPLCSELKTADLPITKGESYDILPLDCQDARNWELMNSKKCRRLFSCLKETYDWIVVEVPYTADSIEVEALVRIFDYAAITVGPEKFNQLHSLVHTIREEGKQSVTTFLTMEDT